MGIESLKKNGSLQIPTRTLEKEAVRNHAIHSENQNLGIQTIANHAQSSKPSRPDKARRLGYKAKQGVVVYRCAVRRGSRKTMAPKGIIYGKPKDQGVSQMKCTRNLRALAEERCGRKMPDLRVLNSYWVGQDGTYKYYEIIMVDPFHNAVRNDAKMNWICKGHQKHRELHGLTSAGRKSRGLRIRGNKDNKRRPSRRANYLRRNKVDLKRYR